MVTLLCTILFLLKTILAAKEKGPAYFPLKAILELPIPERKPFEIFLEKRNMDINASPGSLPDQMENERSLWERTIAPTRSTYTTRSISENHGMSIYDIPALAEEQASAQVYAANALKNIESAKEILHGTLERLGNITA